MKITVLTENNARIDNYLLSEPGLSLLIEAKDKKILFDTGYSDEMNQIIGTQMLIAFSQVGNKYSLDFFETSDSM